MSEANECRCCGETLHLINGYEWPEEGAICWACLNTQRTDLLAACEAIVGKWDAYGEDNTSFMGFEDYFTLEDIIATRAAISKAKGGAR